MNASLNHALEKEVKHARKMKLRKLKMVMTELEAAERKVDELRGVKWGLVTDLKNLGHDFTATTEGMNVVLSASPSFNWSRDNV
jgi:hypothetical protein|tara:strand:- start:350 stop:601 length:252 start_codon:yes stop_codon:yes gene_type:complete